MVGSAASTESSQTPQHTPPVLALGVRLGLTLDFAPPNVDETPPDAALCAILGLYLQLRSALGMPRFDDGAESHAKRSNDYFRYTSAMNDHFTHAQKIAVVEHMWLVAYADGDLDAHENHVISKVAGLLHVTHGEYIAAKLYAKEAAGLT